MVDSILIGKEIYKQLNSSQELKSLVGEKIYPLAVTDEDVTFPFVIFYRTNIRNLINKDGYYEDEVSFTVVSVSNSYVQSLEMANIIRRIFEKRRIGEKIYNVIVESVDEDFIENAYVQQIYFTCKMEN